VNESDREQQRAIVKQWEKTGEELDAMRRERLRNKPWDLAEVDALLKLGERQPSRTTSGLIEMQRIFMKAAPEWYKRERGIEE